MGGRGEEEWAGQVKGQRQQGRRQWAAGGSLLECRQAGCAQRPVQIVGGRRCLVVRGRGTGVED